jgi:hypothetical protein
MLIRGANPSNADRSLTPACTNDSGVRFEWVTTSPYLAPGFRSFVCIIPLQKRRMAYNLCSHIYPSIVITDTSAILVLRHGAR